MIYDIAVIGAGPAGATFARQIAVGEKDYTVLLIDGQNEENKKPCGGLLAPDAQKALAHFDLVLPKNILASPQIFAVKTIDLGRKAVRYYQRYYLNMDRFAFDRWLLSLVPAAVDIMPGRCLKIEKQDGLYRIQASAGGEERVFLCRQIVGADGADSLVRNAFFNSRVMRYIAIQQWFKNDGRDTPFYSCIFDPETSESCSWLLHKDEYIIYGGCFQPQNCRAAFERQKQRLADFLDYDLGPAEKTEACLASRPRKLADFITGKEGAYLIGEAAGFISASSFEGISSAILSGSMLATAFLSCKDEKEIAGYYHRKTRQLRCKLYLKTKKRWFMYTPWVRNLIMKSGVDSIRIQSTK